MDHVTHLPRRTETPPYSLDHKSIMCFPTRSAVAKHVNSLKRDVEPTALI